MDIKVTYEEYGTLSISSGGMTLLDANDTANDVAVLTLDDDPTTGMHLNADGAPMT